MYAGIPSYCQEPSVHAYVYQRIAAILFAGSLIWINFDRHALLSLVKKLGGTFVANVDDVRPQLFARQIRRSRRPDRCLKRSG